MLLFLKGLSLVLLNTPRFLKKILVCSAKKKLIHKLDHSACCNAYRDHFS